MVVAAQDVCPDHRSSIVSTTCGRFTPSGREAGQGRLGDTDATCRWRTVSVSRRQARVRDRCFAILYPPQRRDHRTVRRGRFEREAFLEKMIIETAAMPTRPIDAVVTGRPKHQYSIYRKMMEQNRPFRHP